MIKRVLKSHVIHTDDTSVSVLDASLPKTRTGRFWVYVGDGNPYTVYDYTPSRKRDGPQSFLKDYTDYLVADAFVGYDGIYTTQNVTQVLCWARARRKFHDAQRVQSLESQVALAFIARLYQVEREALNAQPEDCLANASIRQEWFEQRLQLRQTHSHPILKKFQEWLEDTQSHVLPKSPVGEAIRYVLPRWASFVRYCEAGQSHYEGLDREGVALLSWMQNHRLRGDFRT